MDKKEELFNKAHDELRKIIEELRELDVFIPEIEIEIQSYIKKYTRSESH